jgi:ribonucleoside-diphosphate reductase alpha chain
MGSMQVMENNMQKEKFYWLNEESRKYLSKGYLTEGQTAEQRIMQIAQKAEYYLEETGFADKFFDYMGRGWFSLSSPVWSNYATDRGFPVSCFGSYVPDSMEGIMYTVAENGMLMRAGGGTSGYFGAVRPRGAEIKSTGGTTNGSVHFMRLFDVLADVVSQANVRRGFFSAYLPIEHPDADEFLDIGSDGNQIQELTTGITVTDDFMKRVESGDKEAQALWKKLLKKRSEHGYPYIFFTDNVNNNKPECYKDMPIYASNMCTEIALPSNEDETFVCVLSSMNLLHYEEWKDTDAVEVLTKFLDTVVTELLVKLEDIIYDLSGDDKYQDQLQRIYWFAKNHRALGLGALGWHSYLQSKGIPFESKEAAKLNYEIFRNIRERSEQASIALAADFGSVMGTNRRNTTLLAVAPTKSSSFILGQVSQGIEPILSNYFIDDKAKARVVYKSPYLVKLLQERGKDTQATWDMIMKADGSVQLLPFLTDEEKEVFKTFAEINPEAILSQAAVRQEFIDQAQSINLMIPADLPLKELNSLYFTAWKLGIKSLYYQYSLSAAQEFTRSKAMSSECVACHS